MLKEEYSPYKVVHHQDKLSQLRRGEQIAPVQVHLIPSNRCNQSCTFCAYRIPGHSSSQNFDAQDLIPGPKLMEIIDSCKALGVRAIQYTGGGEPLAHPDIAAAFRRTLDLGLDLALVTNGMALDDELIGMLSDVAWVRVSVDCSNHDTYSLIRRVKSQVFERVLKNVGDLARRKKGTTLGIGFVVNAENHGEIYEACKLFKGLGVDNFRISAAFTPKGFRYFDSFFQSARELAQRAKADFEDADFTVFNLFGDRIADLFHGEQDYDYCPMKEFVPYIGADLGVYTCCMLAYNDDGYIGSLKDMSLEQLWNSKEKRELFARHSPRTLCRIPCMFENKNRFINYCIKDDPTHINFI
jgi:MoaA/NifB/PqqE/SkfB family radical SAM enzyme